MLLVKHPPDTKDLLHSLLEQLVARMTPSHSVSFVRLCAALVEVKDEKLLSEAVVKLLTSFLTQQRQLTSFLEELYSHHKIGIDVVATTPLGCILQARINYLREKTKCPLPPLSHSWSMDLPPKLIIEFPIESDLVAFFQSPTEKTFTKTGLGGIVRARKLATICTTPTEGLFYSVTTETTGTGKNAKCVITKTKLAHEERVKAHHNLLKEIEKIKRSLKHIPKQKLFEGLDVDEKRKDKKRKDENDDREEKAKKATIIID
eukprot:TRINITY_DN7861_c0_g1_i1.p1 TRINITY_DN7861_c0_g1~~TRINITY_DN7861_c0_g1_i1.p1  ORF type:complete len:276 (-),score=76.96 TRINITY_DN7861_c0_g1_i1:140-922(-)